MKFTKKVSTRKRTVKSLKDREIERYGENFEKLQENIPQKPMQDPDSPYILETRDKRFTIYRDRIRNFPWLRLSITFAIILIGGVGSAWFQARNTNLGREIILAERELQTYANANFGLNSELQELYTSYEIERIARERLGMSHPDASQVININVPRVGSVTLNVDEHALPQQNYFWNNVSNFLSGLLGQIFGS
ncbi:MAG: hypothetical protein FWF81_07785 [Defluviitaleaceae bacterium]|nr:hypothetical protein [Defluviitaleaceae bacterium]